ncbi:hypothetical protein DF3PB_600015 [uncultured Defluviicoccus sp.]|uniref:Uncharacterized protein n=1 Tax=metagenome TaxID=256318 RepID=A0A380TKJ5_9ZZZZ|nr:hypothetical protein DF3PB_600015 [uncultured Defluviicoccus sp.]
MCIDQPLNERSCILQVLNARPFAEPVQQTLDGCHGHSGIRRVRLPKQMLERAAVHGWSLGLVLDARLHLAVAHVAQVVGPGLRFLGQGLGIGRLRRGVLVFKLDHRLRSSSQ